MDIQTGCPDGYDELFVNYFPMMQGIVARSGIAPEDVEDVAMEILVKFIEKEGIDYYDPDRLNDVGENPDLPGPRFRKAKFKGMLRGFTATYVMQWRDKQMIRHKWFPHRLETPVRGADSNNVRLKDVLAEQQVMAEVDMLERAEVATSIISAIRTAREVLEPQSEGKRDYCRFFDVALEHGLLDGKLDRKTLAAELEISTSTVTAMLKELRAIMRPLLKDVGVLSDEVA